MAGSVRLRDRRPRRRVRRGRQRRLLVVAEASINRSGRCRRQSSSFEQVVHPPSRRRRWRRSPSRLSIGHLTRRRRGTARPQPARASNSARSTSSSGRQTTARPASRLAAARSSRSSASTGGGSQQRRSSSPDLGSWQRRRCRAGADKTPCSKWSERYRNVVVADDRGSAAFDPVADRQVSVGEDSLRTRRRHSRIEHVVESEDRGFIAPVGPGRFDLLSTTETFKRVVRPSPRRACGQRHQCANGNSGSTHRGEFDDRRSRSGSAARWDTVASSDSIVGGRRPPLDPLVSSATRRRRGDDAVVDEHPHQLAHEQRIAVVDEKTVDHVRPATHPPGSSSSAASCAVAAASSRRVRSHG